MADVLTIRVCDADRQPVCGAVHVEVTTEPQGVRVVDCDAVCPVTIDGLYPAQRYRVDVTAPGRLPVSRQVFGAVADVELYAPVDPSSVTEIVWPVVYPEALTQAIDGMRIAALAPEPRAGLLNIFAKLSKADLWRYVTCVSDVRGDRIFAAVDGRLRDSLAWSPAFAPADGSLHPEPDGFTRIGSWKERDVAHGVLQVTLFARGGELTADSTGFAGEGEFTADIDIDDAGGFAHVFQVLDHWLTRGATHPYGIHQILTFHQGLNPGYRLVV